MPDQPSMPQDDETDDAANRLPPLSGGSDEPDDDDDDDELTPGEVLLGAAAGRQMPEFADPWELWTYAKDLKLEERSGLAEAFIRMAAMRPPLERDNLILAGKEVFKYTIATAREAAKKIAEESSGTSRVAPMVGTSDFLAEMIYRPNYEKPLGYLVHYFDRPDDLPTFLETIQTPQTTYYPPSTGLLEAGVILLPTTVEEYGSDNDLFIAVRAYVSNFLQVEDPEFKTLICCYILMTWLYDRFNTVPYLRAQGDFSSGKSRLLQVVSSVCYRPTLAGGATTSSPIFRVIERFRGTLAIDEADFDRSDLWLEIVKILNAGYQRGFPVLRSERDANGEFDVMAYDVFGPKILATRRRFNDEALESRCLSYTMPLIEQLAPRIPLELGDDFRIAAQQLRNKLLFWRFRKWATTRIVSTRLPGVEPRANQIIQPMISSTTDPALQATLRKLIIRYSHRVSAERRDSLPGLVAHAILGRWLRQGKPGSFSLKAVVEELQIQYDLTKVSPRRVSHEIRGTLGLTTEQKGGHAHVFMTPEQAAQLAKRYSYDLTPLTTTPGSGAVDLSPLARPSAGEGV